MKKPLRPPTMIELWSDFSSNPELMSEFVEAMNQAGGPTPDQRYYHWDSLRHRPTPEGLDHRRWWHAIKTARSSISRVLPIVDASGRPFKLAMPDLVWRMIRDVDTRATSTIRMSEPVTSPRTRSTYLVRQLLDEAITSSQLEGAAMTRREALEMVRDDREPQDTSERMVLNNYHAMQAIRGFKDSKLTQELIFEIHRIVTEGTLDDPDDAGRPRRPDDPVHIYDRVGNILYTPPDASELPSRLAAMCEFANDDGDDPYIHPVVRSILLHLWLACDHPFVDGNGRTARALFYWSMLRRGYWLCEFLSISKILREAPTRYQRSFLYVETDDNDATYFVLNQLEVLNRSIDDLYSYLERKTRELHDIDRVLSAGAPLGRSLNHRQLDIVRHALRNPGYAYTIAAHRNANGVSYQTARTDLLDLVESGILLKGKGAGRTFVFTSPADLEERLRILDS